MRRVLACVLVLACERGVGPKSTVAPEHGTADGPVSPKQADDVFVRVTGQGATEDEAYAAAVRALATELLGDARWLDVADVELHERTSALDVSRGPEGRLEVTLQITHSEASAAIAAFADSEPSVVAPEVWRETIYAYLFAHIREHACVRKRALFHVECETGTTEEADAALKALGRTFALAPALRGGVPLDAKGRPLHEPAVLAHWNGAPATGIPLRVAIDDAVTRIQTGDDGRASIALPDRDAWPGRVRVTVDAEALLGPAHAAWPGEPLDLESRALDLRRWTVVIADDGGAEIGNAPRQALVEAMRDAGFGDPKEFRGLAKIGTRMREPGRLVAATRGEVDLVVVVSLGSWYLSRADGGRVWYAAKGKIGAFNPWKPDDAGFPSFALEATANGVGDERAELAARTKFCADAGKKLAAMLAKKS